MVPDNASLIATFLRYLRVERRSAHNTIISYEMDLQMHACQIVSQSRGGEWELNNLKVGCPECHLGWEPAGRR